ncbi:hypothetical protein RJJ37_32165 [Rhizobium redzepovicii]|uniref:Uncharacterized protein n=1 Tax=Rhizobium redzepovicii TaxID=2867518 RepID=A0AAW8PB04_9HYPH|nr:hypothetical protein [Rhizobium redzepovicii]
MVTAKLLDGPRVPGFVALSQAPLVAKENLGEYSSLLAAAALIIDYVLNVAVGVSAGVGALVSAMPGLRPYILPLYLGVVLLVMFANLRGTGEAGSLFALPTYVFILLHEPLLRLIEKLDADSPERRVAVLIPETVKDKWWQNLLHMNRAGRLRANWSSSVAPA